MDTQKKTIKDILNAIPKGSGNSNSRNAREVWEGIARKKSFDELGFSSEEELKTFIVENPYDTIA